MSVPGLSRLERAAERLAVDVRERAQVHSASSRARLRFELHKTAVRSAGSGPAGGAPAVLLRIAAGHAAACGHTHWDTVGPATIAPLLNAANLVGPATARRLARALSRLTRYLGHSGMRTAELDASLAPFLRRRADRRSRGPEIPPGLAAGIADYVAHLTALRRLRPSTITKRAAILRRWATKCGKFGHTTWSTVTRERLLEHLAAIARARSAVATTAAVVSVARGFGEYLTERGLHPSGWGELQPPRAVARRPPMVLAADEVRRLLESVSGADAIAQRDRAALEFAYATGVRVGELLSLRLDQLDMRNRLALVCGKGDKERIVVFGRLADEALRAYLESGRPRLAGPIPSPILFLSRDGQPLQRIAFAMMLRRRARAAGIERGVHPHLLRHTFATHMLDGGADLRVIQELMGHASIETTAIYLQVSRRSLASTLAKFHPRHAAAAVDNSEPSPRAETLQATDPCLPTTDGRPQAHGRAQPERGSPCS